MLPQVKANTLHWHQVTAHDMKNGVHMFTISLRLNLKFLKLIFGPFYLLS